MKNNTITTSYNPIPPKSFPNKTFKHPEQRQLKKFKIEKEFNFTLPSKFIYYCQTIPTLTSIFTYDNITIYDKLSDSTITNFPQINESITSGIFREDGKVIITGTKSGKIILHDIVNKNMLRKYNAFQLEVNSIDIDSSLINFVSASKDCSFKLFEMSSKTIKKEYNKAHNDYIRCCKYFNDNDILTGSYDKKIKLWDIRENNCSLIFDNKNINEDIFILDNNYFITTSDNEIVLYDIRKQEELNRITPLKTNISKLISSKNKERLFLLAPNEKFIKILDLSNLSFQSLYSIKFNNKIVSFDISNDMNNYSIGFDNGEVLIKSKNIINEYDESKALNYDEEEKNLELLDPSKYAEKSIVKNYKYFNRGQYIKNLDRNTDIYIEKQKKKKLQKYDIYIKKFLYHEALDYALKTKQTEIIMGVIEELINRNTLKMAILKRNEEDVILLLNFILLKIREPKIMNILIYIFDLMINYYIIFIEKNEEINKLFKAIEKEINNEIKFEKELFNIKDEINNIIEVYNNIN